MTEKNQAAEALTGLHATLAKYLAESLEADECPASTAEVARKFLQDNGIALDLEGLVGDNEQAKTALRALPFSPPDEEAEENFG